MAKISVVINTRNEEKKIKDAVSKAKKFADEVVVVDMKSDDLTVKIAKSQGAKVFSTDYRGYVEPARNFAISKASNEWILLLDPDEEVPDSLVRKIKNTLKKESADYYRIPRKNVIFGKWIQNSRWWPDYNIRLFKKGFVVWEDEIHSIPITKGKGADFEIKERFAIIHKNYNTIEEYLGKMHRYTSVQAAELIKKDYKFVWKDLVFKPLGEFLSRFFAGEGYKDGLHGLALSMLQAFSEMVVYLKIWQGEKFMEQAITLDEVVGEFGKVESDLNWWIGDAIIKNKGFVKSLPVKIRRKIKKRK